jgi:transposase-like protein
MEVVAGGRRRSFSTAEKQPILQAADRCSAPGEVGALMRREGVYSSSLSTWRKQRKAAELAALAPHKRGPKPAADQDQVLQIAQLRRDNDRLQSRLDKALFVIEVQKKVAALLGQPIDDNGENT